VVKLSPPVAQALLWTRAEGVLLDVAAATLAAFAVGHALGHGGLGAALGAAAGGLRATRWTSLYTARVLQRRRPVLGTALEAYLEGKGGRLRGRLEGWLAQRTAPSWLPRGVATLALAAALAALSLALPTRAPAALPKRPLSSGLSVLSVTARVEPPGYTGLPAVPAEPPRISGLRHSVVHLLVQTSAERLLWAEKGGPPQELVPVEGRASLSLPLDRSRSLRLASDAGGPVLLLELDAVPDEAPRVTLEAPATDRTVTTRPGMLQLRASASDDVGVAGLGFHWTLAEGQGEGMRFRSGALAGRTTLSGKTAEGTAELDPVALGLKPGSTLVVWAEARDTNTLDGPGLGRSDVRLLRWEEAVVDFTGTASGAHLPPPSAQLSERELLARTERLVKARPRAEVRRARSGELGEVQRRIRESFGFFLQMENRTGPELDVDAAEVAESGDLRARKFLAQAVSEMWAAEAELDVGNPKGALAPERAAVKALDEAFGHERLALRALRPPDKPVDEAKRLSGPQVGLRPKPSTAQATAGRDTHRVEVLARGLLLASQQDVTPQAARALADALWALPTDSGLPVAALAAPLYAGTDGAALRAAAGDAAVSLARWLLPSPEVIPPVSSGEAALLARLPLPPLPP
jgi:Domain of unknown function (DUF4175)